MEQMSGEGEDSLLVSKRLGSSVYGGGGEWGMLTGWKNYLPREILHLLIR